MLDDEILALLAERLQGRNRSPRTLLITLVNEHEGIPHREVLEQYPLNEVIGQLQETEDLWRCAECQRWTRLTEIVEAKDKETGKKEKVCFSCRPDLARKLHPDWIPPADVDEDEADSEEARNLNEEMRSFMPPDDDDGDPANDSTFTVLEDP